MLWKSQLPQLEGHFFNIFLAAKGYKSMQNQNTVTFER